MDQKELEILVRKTLTNLSHSPVMNLKLAERLISEVEAEAERMGLAVVVAVSDAAGRPVAVHCMDGAYIGSFDIAINKTFTSVAFKMPTKELAKLAAPGGSLYGIQHTNQGKVVIFGGGEPLYINDVLVGAIGVSGGSAEQDTRLGEYGKNKLKDVI